MDKWIDSAHCGYRAHCDYCLGQKSWHRRQGQNFDMPTFSTCPWGETLTSGKERRAALIIQRVKDGTLTAQQAIDSLVALDIDVDTEVSQP